MVRERHETTKDIGWEAWGGAYGAIHGIAHGGLAVGGKVDASLALPVSAYSG